MAGVLSAVGSGWEAHAGVYDRAAMIFKRIAHVPPSDAQLQQMVAYLNNSGLSQAERDAGAADVAILDRNFYNVSLPALFGPTTNRERAPSDLNDAVALGVGIVRDDIPFKEILYGDHYYLGASTLNLGAPSTNLTLYDWRGVDNTHYARLRDLRLDLADPQVLVHTTQTETLFNPALANPVNSNGTIEYNVVLQSTTNTVQTSYPADVAGVMTTRASAAAFFSAGTNRRMFRYTLMNYLCNDLENIKDNTVSDQYVRRDVDRNPGGTAATFQTNCKGCHGIQDAISGAFALFTFGNNRMSYRRALNPGAAPSVQGKVTQNGSVYLNGHIPNSDQWVNTIMTGVDPAKVAYLGWRAPATGGSEFGGNGANSLGKALAHTRAFSSCQVKRVFKHVCMRDPASSEASRIEAIADQFEGEWNYNFKSLFKAVVNVCL